MKKRQKVCLALSDTTEVIAWGEPTWRVRGKMFAMLDDCRARDRLRRGERQRTAAAYAAPADDLRFSR